MTVPKLTIHATCDSCRLSFEIDGDSLKRGTADGLRCPVCSSNVLLIDLEHASDEWDGTLEESGESLRESGGFDTLQSRQSNAFTERCPKCEEPRTMEDRLEAVKDDDDTFGDL